MGFVISNQTQKATVIAQLSFHDEIEPFKHPFWLNLSIIQESSTVLNLLSLGFSPFLTDFRPLYLILVLFSSSPSALPLLPGLSFWANLKPRRQRPLSIPSVWSQCQPQCQAPSICLSHTHTHTLPPSPTEVPLEGCRYLSHTGWFTLEPFLYSQLELAVPHGDASGCLEWKWHLHWGLQTGHQHNTSYNRTVEWYRETMNYFFRPNLLIAR